MVTVLTLMSVLVSGMPSPVQATSHQAACTFTLLQRVEQAEVIGPPEIHLRAHVLAQPDSPLAIVRVDLSGLKLSVHGPALDHAGKFRIQVQNVSNRAIKDARVMLMFWSGRVGGGHGPAWKQPLPPGAAVWLSGNTRGSGVSPGVDMETDLELRVVVESVEIEGCVYKPAQAHRITGPGNLLPMP